MTPSILWLPYAANIIILVPVVWGMFLGGGVETVFEGKVVESEGLRLLVGSLWLAILLGSLAGLFAPRFMLPLLLVQIVYKSAWLLAFAMPLGMRTGWDAVPSGITIVFVGIVLTYPFFVWRAW